MGEQQNKRREDPGLQDWTEQPLCVQVYFEGGRLHFLPLSVLVIVTGLTAFILWPSRAPRCLLVIALGIAAKPTLSIAVHKVVLSGGVPQADTHLQKTREQALFENGMDRPCSYSIR